VARSVQEFVSSVASTDEPVPAGGSVTALTGAASAALLARGDENADALRAVLPAQRTL
jgi:Formiminotransferase-cyclodeaminase